MKVVLVVSFLVIQLILLSETKNKIFIDTSNTHNYFDGKFYTILKNTLLEFEVKTCNCNERRVWIRHPGDEWNRMGQVLTTDRALNESLDIHHTTIFGPMDSLQHGPMHDQLPGPIDGRRHGPMYGQPNGPMHSKQHGPMHDQPKGPMHSKQHGPMHDWRPGGSLGPKDGRQYGPTHGEHPRSSPSPDPVKHGNPLPKYARCQIKPRAWMTPTNIETQPITHSCDQYDRLTSKFNILGQAITSDVIATWQCFVPTGGYCQNEEIELNFNIAVKAGKKVNVVDENGPIEFIETDLSVNHYDGYHIYRYTDGKFINLKCTHSYSEGYVTMQYYDADDLYIKAIEEPQVRQVLLFQQKMNSTHNGTHVDCNYRLQVNKYTQEYTYRIIFIIEYKPPTDDRFILSVNGINATQLAHHRVHDAEIYVYEYVAGEMINFTCQVTDEQLAGALLISYHSINTDYINDTITPIKYSKSISLNSNLQNMDGASLRCKSGEVKSSIMKFRLVNNTANGAVKGIGSGGVITVICVSAVILAVVFALCVVYWCRRFRNSVAAQRLNESLSEYNNQIWTHPNQYADADDYEYTYIENEYNYIGNEGLMRENSLYRQSHQRHATPQIRYSVNSSRTNEYVEPKAAIKNPNSVPEDYEERVHNKTGRPIYRESYESAQNENNKKLQEEIDCRDVGQKPNVPENGNNVIQYSNLKKCNVY